MNRRQMLAGGAAIPADALPLPALAIAANGTDAAWSALAAAEANHSAAVLALDDAEVALWKAPPAPAPTAELPAGPGILRPGHVTLAELRKARDADAMLCPLDERALEAARRMIDDEMAIRPHRTPEAIAERRALYGRLEAELVKKEPANACCITESREALGQAAATAAGGAA